jgi:subtilisin family serine protease
MYQELDDEFREVDFYVVPNRYTLPNGDSIIPAFDGTPGEDRSDGLGGQADALTDWAGLTVSGFPPDRVVTYDGHGTSVASLAGGINLGVASNANLMLVKYQNAAKNTGPPMGSKAGLFIPRQVQARAILDAFEFIIQDVATKRLGGKSVINFSAGR